MNTLVIWYQSKDSSSNLEAELHFNLWKIKRKRDWTIQRFFNNRTDYFLDFGLMISDIAKVDKIFIYIPDVIDNTNIEDMGEVLQTEMAVLRSIFNEEYSCSPTTDNPKLCCVKDKNDNSKFNIYKLEINLDVTFNTIKGDKFEGTIVEITNNIKTPTSTPKVYFRLRLTSNFVEKISHTHIPTNSFIESFSTNTEIIDFRLNENRNIPASLLEKMKSLSEFNFNKIHFLILRNIKDDYIFSNKEIYNSRELEKNIWSKYVSEKIYDYKKILAYHFKEIASEDKKVTDFNLLVKYRYENSNFGVIVKYLFIIFCFDFFFNKISNHISLTECFKYLISIFK